MLIIYTWWVQVLLSGTHQCERSMCLSILLFSQSQKISQFSFSVNGFYVILLISPPLILIYKINCKTVILWSISQFVETLLPVNHHHLKYIYIYIHTHTHTHTYICIYLLQVWMFLTLIFTWYRFQRSPPRTTLEPQTWS